MRFQNLKISPFSGQPHSAIVDKLIYEYGGSEQHCLLYLLTILHQENRTSTNKHWSCLAAGDKVAVMK